MFEILLQFAEGVKGYFQVRAECALGHGVDPDDGGAVVLQVSFQAGQGGSRGRDIIHNDGQLAGDLPAEFGLAHQPLHRRGADMMHDVFLDDIRIHRPARQFGDIGGHGQGDLVDAAGLDRVNGVDHDATARIGHGQGPDLFGVHQVHGKVRCRLAIPALGRLVVLVAAHLVVAGVDYGLGGPVCPGRAGCVLFAGGNERRVVIHRHQESLEFPVDAELHRLAFVV